MGSNAYWQCLQVQVITSMPLNRRAELNIITCNVQDGRFLFLCTSLRHNSGPEGESKQNKHQPHRLRCTDVITSVTVQFIALFP